MEFTHKKKKIKINGVSKEDHIYKQIAKNNSFYEKDLLNYMESILNYQIRKVNNTVAIDVGANIGNHSVFFGAFLSDHVISIEPNDKVLPTLHKNLSLNIDNYTIFECGAGEEKGIACINLPAGAENNVGMSKLSLNTTSKEKKIEVSTIDLIFEKWQGLQKKEHRPSIIKIDVEGMELSVLKGAIHTITKYKPDIFAEAATFEEYNKLINHLSPLGYRKLTVWAETPVYHFAFKPSVLLILRANTYKTFSLILRIKQRVLGL